MPAPKDPEHYKRWIQLLSEQRRGKKLDPQHRRKIADAQRGRKHSLETRLKMSANQAGSNNSFWGKRHTPKTISIIRRKLKKRRLTPEHRARIGKAHKGRTLSPEARKKMSLAKIGIPTGSKSPTWNGGITSLRKAIRTSAHYRQWRNAVFRQDNFSCVLCGKRGGRIEADHYPSSFASILRRFGIKNLRQAFACSALWDVSNGRTLCHECHRATPNYLAGPLAWRTQSI